MAVASRTALNLVFSHNRGAIDVPCQCLSLKVHSLSQSSTGRVSRRKGGDFSASVAFNPSGNFDLSFTNAQDGTFNFLSSLSFVLS